MIVKKGMAEELRWFYEARFGMFVHFGVSSMLGRGEWVMYHEGIPVREYKKLAERFDPSGFRAEDWVGLAVDAGARYMTVTAKHHDGFCLFDTKLTPFKSTNTPFGRDLIGELADECSKRSLPLVLYYSQPDWHHPNFVHKAGAFKDLDNPGEDNSPDWNRYLDFYFGQVEELMVNYKPAGIWFDGSHKTEAEWKGKEIYDLIKGHNAHAVVNDRGRYGDFFTPERSLPEDLTGYLFEACQSVSKQAWGYREDSTHFTTPELVRSLQKMAGAGGNYLLNVGPKPDGTIDEVQRRIMLGIGNWLETNGESIYGTHAVAPARLGAGATGAVPTTALPAGVRLTARDNTLYVHLLQWPETDRLTLPAGGLGSVVDVRLLDSDEKPAFRMTDDGSLEIRLPVTPTGGLPAVLRVDTEKAVPVNAPESPDAHEPLDDRPTCYALNPYETLFVAADDLSRAGRGPKGKRVTPMEIPGYGVCLGGWMDFDQHASFAVEVGAGTYCLAFDFAVPRGFAGGAVAVEVDGVLAAEVILSGTYENEPEDTARGNLTTPCARDFSAFGADLTLTSGRHSITIRPHRLHWGYLLGFLGTVRLRAV